MLQGSNIDIHLKKKYIEAEIHTQGTKNLKNNEEKMFSDK
jgi:hypothetical protein